MTVEDSSCGDPLRATAQRHTLRALRVAQVFGGIGQAAGGSAGALVARDITGSAMDAGWPQAAITAGAPIAAVCVSALAERTSRRLSLGAAFIAGALGATIAAAAAPTQSLALLLIGSGLFGAGNAAVMLARYAATDLAADSNRGRAIAAVLVATSIGAAAGPNLLAPAVKAATSVGIAGYAGPYLAGVIAYVIAAASLLALLRPDPLRLARAKTGSVSEVRTEATWPLLRRRASVAAVAALGIANCVMVGLMAMAPLELVGMGRGLGVVGAVISVHIAAMFAPSPLSGRLTDRLGAPRTIAVSGLVLVGSALCAVVGVHSTVVLTIAVLLLGSGWNIAVVAASAMLTATVAVPSRPRLEAAGEVWMGIAATVGGATSGLVVAAGGYTTLAAACAGCALPLLLAPSVLNERRGLPTTVHAPPEPVRERITSRP
jgi:MFS family permease